MSHGHKVIYTEKVSKKKKMLTHICLHLKAVLLKKIVFYIYALAPSTSIGLGGGKEWRDKCKFIFVVVNIMLQMLLIELNWNIP